MDKYPFIKRMGSVFGIKSKIIRWAHFISNVEKAGYSFVWHLIGLASQSPEKKKKEKENTWKSTSNTKIGTLKIDLFEMRLDLSYSTNVQYLDNKFSCGKKAKGNFNTLRRLYKYVEKSIGFKAERVLMIWITNLEAPIHEILRNLKSYNRIARNKKNKSKKLLTLRIVTNKFINRIPKIINPVKIRKKTKWPQIKDNISKLNPAINKMLFPNQANIAFLIQIDKGYLNGFVHTNFRLLLNTFYGWLISVLYCFL